jgi:hypothetical protein
MPAISRFELRKLTRIFIVHSCGKRWGGLDWGGRLGKMASPLPEIVELLVRVKAICSARTARVVHLGETAFGDLDGSGSHRPGHGRAARRRSR